MNITKKIAALAIAGAMVVGGVAVAQSASAAQIAGTITITPTSGNVNSDVNFLNSIAVSVGASSPYNLLSGTFVYQNGQEMGSVAQARSTSMVASAGTNGLDGNAAYMDRINIPTNTFVSNKLLNATLVPLATGPFELRYYYFASTTSPNRATDPYVKLDMTYNATSGAWSVYTAAIATTTALTASASASTVTLTATVKNGAATATAAAGNVEFFDGATSMGVVAVASGGATTTLSSVANGSHSYTAVFTPSDTVYAGSTSGAATAQVGGTQQSSAVTTTIPDAGNGGLTLTGVSSTVALGTAVLNSGVLLATGTLNATVTDARQLSYPAWSLTGQVGDFSDGTHTLSGKYLGWTPSFTGTAAGSAAGALVAPSPTSANGLKTISILATGAPSNAGTVTNASALLTLKAPSNTPAGAYSATLTLTLI